jgi:hypothetical protein
VDEAVAKDEPDGVQRRRKMLAAIVIKGCRSGINTGNKLKLGLPSAL